MKLFKKLSISVIIPALDAAKTLDLTLSALRSNTVKPNEILVVDGLSKDDTPNVARQFGCKVITNRLKHTAAARQMGINVAQSEIIAMTDSDCIPPSDWLEKIYQHFVLDAKLDGVGGIARFAKPATRVQAYSALKAVHGIPKSQELIIRKGMRGRFAGSNCAYKRNTLLEVGGYDLRFKTHGSDIDLFWRLVDKKMRLLFDPALTVEHLGFSRDLPSLARKSFGYGIGSARLAHSHFPDRQLDLTFYWRPLVATIQEFFHKEQPRYPECVFVDNFIFAIGRTWGLINRDNINS